MLPSVYHEENWWLNVLLCKLVAGWSVNLRWAEELASTKFTESLGVEISHTLSWEFMLSPKVNP